MAQDIAQQLADKNIHPPAENLRRLETKFDEILDLKSGLNALRLDDADLAIRNIPGGDHVD